MTDILAKATVEFGQPLISLNFRELQHDQKGITCIRQVDQSEHATLFEVPFDGWLVNYDVDIEIRRRCYSDCTHFMRVDRSDNSREEFKNLLAIMEKIGPYFSFQINHHVLSNIKLDHDETLLFIFTVRREDFISEVKKRLREEEEETAKPLSPPWPETVSGLHRRVEELEESLKLTDLGVKHLEEREEALRGWKNEVDKKLVGHQATLTLLISDVASIDAELTEWRARVGDSLDDHDHAIKILLEFKKKQEGNLPKS
jgi:hypothetical protein